MTPNKFSLVFFLSLQPLYLSEEQILLYHRDVCWFGFFLSFCPIGLNQMGCSSKTSLQAPTKFQEKNVLKRPADCDKQRAALCCHCETNPSTPLPYSHDDNNSCISPLNFTLQGNLFSDCLTCKSLPLNRSLCLKSACGFRRPVSM